MKSRCTADVFGVFLTEETCKDMKKRSRWKKMKNNNKKPSMKNVNTYHFKQLLSTYLIKT